MLDAKKALALANQYTDDSLAGAGALEGKPCQIQSITPITGGNRIKFLWFDNDGVSHTETMDVMNGADGQDGTNGTNGTDGVGITSIEKTGTSGLVDTYTITLTNGDTETFDVTNGADGQDGTNGTNGTDGVGISSITKTGTSGLVDTYTITLTNGNTETFTVTNGADGQDGTNGTNGTDGVGISSITKTGTSGLVDTYTITLTNGNTETFTVTNGADGQDGTNGTNGTDGVGISSITKTGTSGLVDTYTITLTNGNTETFTVTNGADGQDGTNGADGFSPTATVTKSGDTITIEITDKNGTTTQRIDTSSFATLSGNNILTGRQTIQANEVVFQATNLDKDTAPQASTDGNAYIPFADKDGDAFAVVYTNQRTDGALDLHIDTFAQNNPNGKVIVNGIDVKDRLLRIDGNTTHTWVDIPAAISASGKTTRFFSLDNTLFLGTQIWQGSAMQDDALFYFRPTPAQITLLNGVTTSEQGNCNIFDFGCFCMVNLAGVVIPSTWTGGTAICEIPRTATARLNFRIPTTSAGGEIIYIDAGTKQLKLTNVVDVPIYTNILIPTYSS